MFLKKAKVEIRREKTVQWIWLAFVFCFLVGTLFVFNLDHVGLEGGIAISTWILFGCLLLLFMAVILAEFRRRKKSSGEPGIELSTDHLVIRDGVSSDTVSFYSVSYFETISFPNRPLAKIVIGVRGKRKVLQGYEAMKKIVQAFEKTVGKEKKVQQVTRKTDWGRPGILVLTLAVVLPVSLVALVFFLAVLEWAGLRRFFYPSVMILSGLAQTYISWVSDRDQGVLTGIFLVIMGLLNLFLP